MNTQASATGMQVKAIAGSSLQISENLNFTSGKSSIAFSGSYTLKPSVELDGQKDADGATISSSASKLVTVNNTKDVDPNTGLKKADAEELNYKVATDAATASAPGYYYDYVMYLAAEGSNDPITAGTIKLTIDVPELFKTGSEDEDYEYALKAVSIMVLDASGNKVGEIIRLKDGVDGVAYFTLSSTNYIPSAEKGTRPNVSDAFKITLRVFLDGALTDSATTTYVRNTKIVDLSRSISFGVVFDLELPNA